MWVSFDIVWLTIQRIQNNTKFNNNTSGLKALSVNFLFNIYIVFNKTVNITSIQWWIDIRLIYFVVKGRQCPWMFTIWIMVKIY